ncbi:MAG TPA: hypothetical protein DEQ02_08380, partial [Ruminococcaceae bacterium]|nr:hypothetical protein [Oscillospiraceae bacterium]
MSKKPFSGGRRNARPGGPMGGGPGMPAEKARDFKGAILKTAKYLKPYTIAIIVVVIFAIGSTVLAVAGPKVLGQITNQISEDYVRMQFYENVTENLPAGTVLPPGTTGEDILAQLPEDARAGFEENIPEAYRDSLLKMSFDEKPKIRFDIIENIALTLLTIYIVSALFSYIQSFIMSGVTQKITYRFREDISKKIGRIPLRYFDSRTHGDILSRVTNDVDTINQSLGQSLTQMLTSISTIVGIFVMMLTISWQMTLVTLVTLPIALILIGLVIKRSQKFFASQQQSIGEIGGHVEEMYAGHTVMKLFNGEKRSVEKFKKINDELYKSGWKSQFFSGLMMPIMIFIGNLGYVGVCVLGGYLVIKGHVRPGDVQAFMQYVRQFNQPIAQIANISSVLQSTAAAAERVFEFLEEDEEIPESVNPAVLKNPKGHVEFDHVSFGYNKDKTIIGDFTCKIEPGQKVAIVGPTGAGKTTIVNLLMRFYDVDSGSIKIDGVDIREMKR